MKNLTGKRFGKLVVVEDDLNLFAECKCDCGNTARVQRYCLTSGNTRSCGCIRREHGREAMKKLRSDSDYFGTNFAVITKKNIKGNKSGHTGVWFNEKRGLYEAYINFKRKRFNLGAYVKMEDAVKARERAEDELFTPIIEARNNMGVMA